MNPILAHLRRLPRNELLIQIQRAAEDDQIVLWEQLAYGDMYVVVRAGPQTAAKLGIRENDVIGYKLLVDRPKGCAIGDLMNATPENGPRYPDPFQSTP